MKYTLQGLRILNTRPREQAKQLTRSIRESGGISVECPALEIQPTDLGWINQLPALNTVDCAVFISANAVHYCFQQLTAHQISWAKTIKVLAIGQATAKALQQNDISVDAIPDLPDSEHLINLPLFQHLNQKIVLLFKGSGGRPLIEEQLKTQGAQTTVLEVYQRLMPTGYHSMIEDIWRDDMVDVVLITSGQAMNNLLLLFGKEGGAWLKNKPCIVLSQRLAQIASNMGIKKIVVSHPDRIMNTLSDYSQGLIHDQ